MLHVVQLSFFKDPRARAGEQLLTDWSTLVDVAEAAAQAGIRVSVLQASDRNEALQRGGVNYYFRPIKQALANLLPRLRPDVFHVHGLDASDQILALAASNARVPIVLQDHASRVPRLWRRPTARRALAAAAGIAFCARPQSEPFKRARVIANGQAIYEIPESTSRFTPGEQHKARQATGIGGDPAVLWVGHLDANKDPLAVLEGISLAALPGLHLYCCFGTAPLLSAVQARVATDPYLRGRVHLLGRVPHEQIETLMRAADLFVLGSHREGSGYSLIEALACGLPPVVSDIPSFRALTGDGQVGRLWPCGNSKALAEALRELQGSLGPTLREAVRAHFEHELSFAALGSKLGAMYQAVRARAVVKPP
jgi:glycosyltransferase involved in cell wall biosynthesis